MIFKSTLKFALLAGVFMIVIYHLSFWLGVNPQIDLGHLFVDLVLIGLFVFFAEKDYKTYKNGGILHFWQGMTIGFIVYAIGSAIFLLGQIFYYNFDADAVINYQRRNYLIKTRPYLKKLTQSVHVRSKINTQLPQF